MKTAVVLLGMCLAGLLLSGCHRGDQVPKTAYDPKVLEQAQRIAEMEKERQQAMQEEQEAAHKTKKTECNRETGGCQEGFLCWDSYFCKADLADQCSGSGDKRCHKRCLNDADCPDEMPDCKEVPLFNGTEAGVLEKFCVGGK